MLATIREPDGSVTEKEELLKRYFISEEFFSVKIAALGTSIGHYNQSVIMERYSEIGKKQVLKNIDAAHEQYMKKYRPALKVMQSILNEFYAEESNHGYKPNNVINHICTLCEDYDIEFPESRKGKYFTQIKDAIVKNIFGEKSSKGRTDEKFKYIDHIAFEKLYKKYVI